MKMTSHIQCSNCDLGEAYKCYLSARDVHVCCTPSEVTGVSLRKVIVTSGH